MSGGSFNYLLDKFGAGLIEHRDDLERMAEALESTHPDTLAAVDTRDLLDDIRGALADFDNRADRLRKVWHAYEWWVSCDYGRDQADAAITAYSDAELSREGTLIDEIRQLISEEALRAAPGALLARRINELLRDRQT